MQVDLSSRIVERITSQYVTTLGLTDGAEIQIESRCTLSNPGSELIVVEPPEPGALFNPLAALVGSTIKSAAVDQVGGNLAVEFLDGSKLEVRSDPHFEAWTLIWSDGTRIVSLPGGGVSRWHPT